MYISPYCRLALVLPNFMKFGIRGQLTDVIMCVKFSVNRFRGYGVLTPPKCYFPLTCCVALTTVYALPCDTVIVFSRTLIITDNVRRLSTRPYPKLADDCVISLQITDDCILSNRRMAWERWSAAAWLWNVSAAHNKESSRQASSRDQQKEFHQHKPAHHHWFIVVGNLCHDLWSCLYRPRRRRLQQGTFERFQHCRCRRHCSLSADRQVSLLWLFG